MVEHWSERTPEPTWRLRERVLRQANEIIEGRIAFEKKVYRSTKPLRKMELDPRDLIQLLQGDPE